MDRWSVGSEPTFSNRNNRDYRNTDRHIAEKALHNHKNIPDFARSLRSHMRHKDNNHTDCIVEERELAPIVQGNYSLAQTI